MPRERAISLTRHWIRSRQGRSCCASSASLMPTL
jgi:hypothetical protein